MTRCRRMHPLLSRLAAGESSPEDALKVARHVHDCTPCRILLARERRLAEVLDSLEDVAPAEEEFLRGVMTRLPEKPPPVRRHASARRGLRLAGIAGAIASGAPALRGIFGEAAGGGVPTSLPHLGLETLSHLADGFGGTARLLVALACRLGGSCASLPAWAGDAVGGSGFLLPAAGALVGISGGMAVAALSLHHIYARSRSRIRAASAEVSRPSRRAAAAMSPCSADSDRPTA